MSAYSRRLLRMMAGDIKSPAERSAEREMRKWLRAEQDAYRAAVLVDKIQRREQRDPELPPMPFDFVEIERRRKGGK